MRDPRCAQSLPRTRSRDSKVRAVGKTNAVLSPTGSGWPAGPERVRHERGAAHSPEPSPGLPATRSRWERGPPLSFQPPSPCYPWIESGAGSERSEDLALAQPRCRPGQPQLVGRNRVSPKRIVVSSQMALRRVGTLSLCWRSRRGRTQSRSSPAREPG